MKINLINLTPHAVTIQNKNGSNTVVPPDGRIARVAMVSTPITRYPLDCQQVSIQKGEVENLPAPAWGTIWIVSAMVREACPDRKDLASPGELIRDDKGQPVACRGLIFNA